MTVKDRGRSKHLVQKTNGTSDLQEKPAPPSQPAPLPPPAPPSPNQLLEIVRLPEEVFEEEQERLLRRRCDRDETVSPPSTPKRRLTKESQVETAKKSKLTPDRIPQDTAPLTTYMDLNHLYSNIVFLGFIRSLPVGVRQISLQLNPIYTLS